MASSALLSRVGQRVGQRANSYGTLSAVCVCAETPDVLPGRNLSSQPEAFPVWGSGPSPLLLLGGGRPSGNAQGLTWQRADEFVDIFYVPFGGLAGEEVVSHPHQVPHVHVRELQVPLALSPAGGGRAG